MYREIFCELYYRFCYGLLYKFHHGFLRNSSKNLSWNRLRNSSRVHSGIGQGFVYETDVGFDNDEGTQDWVIDSMLTLNLTLGYKFNNGLRLRGSIINLEDERAPLADVTTWWHVADVHNDYGRRYALELYKRF